MSNSNRWPRSGGANVEHRGRLSSGIEPSPAHWTDTLRDGTSVLIRPIADTDVEIERRSSSAYRRRRGDSDFSGR